MRTNLLTLSQLARRLNVSQHRVKYAIETHGVRPFTRVGIIRVWTEDAIPRIEEALRQISQNKRSRGSVVESGA